MSRIDTFAKWHGLSSNLDLEPSSESTSTKTFPQSQKNLMSFSLVWLENDLRNNQKFSIRSHVCQYPDWLIFDHLSYQNIIYNLIHYFKISCIQSKIVLVQTTVIY